MPQRERLRLPRGGRAYRLSAMLGVLLFAGEYSTGMIRATMLAVPRRTPVLAAKFAVLAAVIIGTPADQVPADAS